MKPVERGIKEPYKLAGNTQGTTKEKGEPLMISEADFKMEGKYARA